MTEQVVIDYSSAHAQITPAAMGRVAGCIGGIGYAGCYNAAKNISKSELHALLDAGKFMALVIEDNVDDLKKGADWGKSQADRLVAAAKELGYTEGVLATGYDTDARGSLDYAGILVGFAAFVAVVTAAGYVPGYYGDSDSIDYLHAHGYPDAFYWQSSSSSFSPKNPTEHAHIWQRWNDPRAHQAGLASAIDINIVRKTPLRFMGESMAITDDDAQKIAHAVWQRELSNSAGTKHSAHTWLLGANSAAHKAVAAADQLAKTLDGVATVLNDAKGGVVVRLAAVQKAISELKPAAIEDADAAKVAAKVLAGVRGLVFGVKADA